MANQEEYIFTSESVGIGHPDKICDQISDAILDACLSQDRESRVAVETLVTTQTIVIAGEVTTKAILDYEKIAREVIEKIGYTSADLGFDYKNANITIKIHQQSSDISQGVTESLNRDNEQGAGDQGMMFGFACNETPELMPLPIMLSHRLVEKARELRENKKLAYLRPDCKSQATIKYIEGKPIVIEYLVLSLNHDENVSQEKLAEDALNHIIKPICGKLISENTKIFINPTGRFVIGGPNGDTGVTGRKIIVDSYGGYARHGGGAFSGKDPSKVDRSAAYAARYVAKNLVAANFCDKCEIQVSYAIGKAKPLNITIDTFGSEKIPKEKIISAVEKVFDLTPKGIITALNLKKPIYQETAFGGHFGRDAKYGFFPWEKTDKVDLLLEAIKESS
jgi:S-adenosylmethionine synthetase